MLATPWQQGTALCLQETPLIRFVFHWQLYAPSEQGD